MKKPPLIAAICGLIGLIILGILGTWQIQKYFVRAHDAALCEQSEGEIHDRNFDSLHQSIANGCSITLSGTVMPAPVVPIVQWNKDGGGDDGRDMAYNIYAYLRSNDGSLILTNLGISNEQTPKIGMGKVQIVGGVYKPSGPGAFSPQNTPEANKWYTLNPMEIKEHFGVRGDISPYVFVAQDIRNVQNQKITRFAPASLHKSYLQPETHLQYALFWYAMACALAAIFFLRFCRKN